MTKRIEVLELFGKFSADGQKLTLLEFVDFLQEEQKEGDHASDLALELIDRHEPSESGKQTRAERHQTGVREGDHDQKGPEIAAFCLTQGRMSPPLPQYPTQSSSSCSATSQRSVAISISCPDKTEISSVMLDLSEEEHSTIPLSSTMLMLHILHLLKVLPYISFWPQWKYSIKYLFLLLWSFLLMCI